MPTDSLSGFVLHVLDQIDAELQMSLNGMELEQLLWRPTPQSNSMAWLAWHIARLQDARAASLAKADQLWVSEGWHERFGLQADETNHGRGHTDEEVDSVRPDSVTALSEYAKAAYTFLRDQVAELEDLADQSELAGNSGDANVRDLVFRAVHGGLAHLGQLMYVRGLVEKRHWFPR